ncbi:MAG: PAS domain S-box protein [Chloroflexi bacterium]|nr:PAS domain S-box protein [Chloroflexota bacterium]
MKFLQNVPIRVKVLLAPILLVAGLLILALLGVYGLTQQNATLESIREDMIVRIRAVDDFALLSEEVQSDVFQIAVLQSMNLPVENILPIQERLETRLNKLNILYGQMLIHWDLDAGEKEHLVQIEEPLDTFQQHAVQAARMVLNNQALGVQLVRSSTISFGKLQAALDELRDHEETRISQANQSARQRAQSLTSWIGVTIIGILLVAGLTALISTRLITRPIRAMTELMTRLAAGDLDIEVAERGRQDEIGTMARAVEVFRKNALEKETAEMALQESRRALETLLGNLPGMAYRCDNDPDWPMRFVSQGCLALTGYPPADLLDNARVAYAQLIHPDDREGIWENVQASLEKNHFFELTYRIRTANNEEKWVWERGEGVFSGDGELVALEGFIIDITERKRAEVALKKSEERFRAAFRTSPDSININRLEDGLYVDINEGFTAITGYTREDTLGIPSTDINIWEDPEDRARLVAELTAQGFVNNLEARFRMKDGHVITGLMSAKILMLDDVPHVLSITRDIEELKQARMALQKYSERLEEMVEARTADLVVANKELEAFSYSVAHDLRSPLRGIDGWSHALLEEYGDQLDEQAHQYLDRVRSQAQIMGHLIDDLLALARINRHQMRRQPIDLTALVQSIAAHLQEEQPQRQVEFVIQEGVTTQGDAYLLEIALTHLLSNAFKFSGPHSPARIEFGQTSVEGQPAYFVCDNGVGFDMAHVSKLFGAFQRLHAPTEFPGTGIGLTIVQRIVYRHGGRVWAEADPGHGATFRFTLKEEA